MLLGRCYGYSIKVYAWWACFAVVTFIWYCSIDYILRTCGLLRFGARDGLCALGMIFVMDLLDLGAVN